jgi:hypothetical protein
MDGPSSTSRGHFSIKSGFQMCLIGAPKMRLIGAPNQPLTGSITISNGMVY